MSDPTTETPASQPSAARPLDRTRAPGVPSAVADLWDGWGYPGGTDPEAVTVALGGVTSIVNAMAGGDTYRVALGGTSTAWTDLKGHRVAITSAALADPRLTVTEALGITTAMAVHEAGHARITAPMQRAVERAFGRSGPVVALANRLSNIVDDVRLEAHTARRWPAYGPLFPLAMWWVAQRYPSGAITRLPESKAEAVNFGLAAIRYGDHTEWGSDPALVAEREWWADWGQRAASTDKPGQHVTYLREALDHMDHLPDQRPQPEQQPAPSPQPGEGSEQGEGEGDGGAGEGQPEDEQPEQRGGGGSDDADDEADEDEDEDDDADGEADGDGDESDEDDEGADWSDEADGDADEDEDTGGEWDDDADSEGAPAPSAPNADDDTDDESGDESDEDDEQDEAEGEDGDGEPDVYKHRDEPGDDLPEGDEDDEADATYYGPASDEDPGQTDEGTEHEYERDALADPLPAHATDAVAQDDRDRDLTLGRVIESQAQVMSREEVQVTHDGGQTYTVTVLPLETDRQRITTNPAVQQAIRAAFTSRRQSRDARDVARSGRVSGHRAYRVRAGFDNVFVRRDQISPDRLDVHLLVDASGSMAGSDGWGGRGPTRLSMASQMAANVTEALERLPYVRVHVWAHNNNGARPRLWDVFDSRKGEALGRIGGIRTSGDNRDASAIRALAGLITRERSNRERSVMVVISDGAPCEPEEWVRGAVEAARTKGIGVMSVAIAGGLTSTQEACYGTDYVVPWTGDWDDLTRGMGKIIGRMA